jgi:iron transport multicopper oxidase
MAKENLGILQTHCITSILRNGGTWKICMEGLAKAYNLGIDVQWLDFHRPFETSLQLLELPSYAFDYQDYWIQNELKRSSHNPRSTGQDLALSSTSHRGFKGEPHMGSIKKATNSFSTTDSTLLQTIQGHLLEGVALCPSSVYLDMALTLATKVMPRIYSANGMAMEVCDMKIFSPLVVIPGIQDPEINVTALKSSGGDNASISFSSKVGIDERQHATCSVAYFNSNDWLQQLHTTAYLILTRMNGLNGDRLQKKMIYRLFSSIVVYSEPYQSITSICLNTQLNEAVATIEFPKSLFYEKSSHSPYWNDVIFHLAGFVLNGNLAASDEIVYISSGWRSLRLLKDFVAEAPYRAYIRLEQDSHGLFVGDVYMFRENEIIATCNGLQFQRIPRKKVRTILDVGGNKPPSAVQISRESSVVAQEPDGENKFSGPAATVDFRQVIADETGYPVETLVDGLSIHNLGIDSLLSNSIVSRIGRETGLKLSTSSFASCSNIGDLKRHLLKQTHSHLPRSESSESASSNTSEQIWVPTPASTPGLKAVNDEIKQLRSNAVFMQGDHNSGLPILFLIADGA